MEEQLAVLAEIAVGLAGFSSIIVVFRRRSSTGAWKPEDALRFKVMLESSLVAGLFALSPGALTGLGLAPSLLWPLHSALLLSYLTFDVPRRLRQLNSLPTDSLNPRIAIFLMSTSVGVIGVQALSIADWLVPRGPGPYIFGVTWLVAYSGVMFYRLMIVPVDSPDSDSPTAA